MAAAHNAVSPSRMGRFLAGIGLVLASCAQAAPIDYTLSLFSAGWGPSPAGLIGNTPFGTTPGGVILTFSLATDTDYVVPFSAPVKGAENLVGVASFQINSGATGAELAHGLFLPSAGIFISVDLTNGGIGFGSAGAMPGTPMFPGNPIYPFAANFVYGAGQSTYGLTTLTDPPPAGMPPFFLLAAASSCVGFPFACTPGPALATSTGDLLVTPSFGGDTGVFFARARTFLMSNFAAGTTLNTHGFRTSGRFVLTRQSTGFDPANESVTFGVGILEPGSYGFYPEFTIPPGSFREVDGGVYEFDGTTSLYFGSSIDTAVHMVLRKGEDRHYTFQVQATSDFAVYPSLSVTTPFAAILMMGDNIGTTLAVAPARHED